MNVLVVTPHADDAEIMCGGTLVLHKRKGDRTSILILASEYLNAPGEQRRAEATEGAKRLGVDDLFFGGLMDGNITDSSDTVKIIDSYIEKTKADMIYSTSTKDRHQDHRKTARAVDSACRNSTRVLACETPSVSQTFLPRIFSDISETFEQKMYALEAHRSQNNGHSVVSSLIEATARFRGSQVFVKYAEGFEVVRFMLW